MTIAAEPQASDYPQAYDRGSRLCVFDNAFAVMVTEILVTPDGQGQETLTFQLPFGDEKRAFLDNEVRIRCAGSEFIVRQVVDGWDAMGSMASGAVSQSRWQTDSGSQSTGTGVVTTQVQAEAAWYDLAACDPVVSLALTAVSPHLALYTILQGSGWRFVGTDIKQPNDFSIAQPLTVLAALRQVQQTWGGELEFDSINKTVGLWRERGSFQQLVYAYGRNLAGDTRTMDTTALATRAWLYGAGNLGVESVNNGTPYVEDYSFFDSRGKPRETRAVVLQNTQLTDPAQLLEWGKNQLALLSQPKPTYELSVAQLPTDPVPGVGDSAIVWDQELDFRTTPRVVRRDLDVLQPYNTQLQFANALPSLPTAQNPNLAGAPSPVMSNGSMVLGDGSGSGSGQSFSTNAQGQNPNVTLDATGVWATDQDGNLRFRLSAITGILTAQAVLEAGSDVPAPVITGQLTDQQIANLQTAKLTGQITTTQITDQAISTPKLMAGAVTTAQIAAFTILAGNIASGTITSTQIAAATIVAGNIASSSITADKLNVGSLSAITANLGTVTAGTISGVTVNGGTINFPNGNLSASGLWLDATGTQGASTYGVQFLDTVTGVLGGYLQMGTNSGNMWLVQAERGSNLTVGAHVQCTASGTYNATLVNGSSGDASFPGTVSSNGTVLTSDARLKRNVEPVGSSLADVRRVRAVHYRSLKPGQGERHFTGFVAQELREVLPHAVVEDEDGTLGIDPTVILGHVVEAVKDLAARQDELIDTYVTGHPMLTLESNP